MSRTILFQSLKIYLDIGVETPYKQRGDHKILIKLGGGYMLDEIDIKILEMLQENGRKPLSDIAAKVKLSPPSVLERVKKLEEKGIIKKFTAILDAKKVGRDITAFIGVSIIHPQYIENFETSIEKFDDILECHHVTGEHTLFLKVKTKDTSTLEQLIRAIRSIDGVTRTLTSVVLSTKKEDTKINLSEGLSKSRKLKE